jgi:DNA-binding XRE family transcriptional regulator
MKKEIEDWNKIVGKNIRKYRREHHETQEMLGEYIGYGATTIANYEKGERMPDLVIAYQIARHYQISMDDLMRRAHES